MKYIILIIIKEIIDLLIFVYYQNLPIKLSIVKALLVGNYGKDGVKND